MPYEDRDCAETDGELLSPEPLLHSSDLTAKDSSQIPHSDVDGGSGETGEAVPKISIDIGDDADDITLKKPLLQNVSNESGDQTNTTSSDGDKHVTKHQSLLTLVTDKPIPRRSSENALAKPDNVESDGNLGAADSSVYKGNKVRFQVTKLDMPDAEGEKPSAAEVAPSVAGNEEEKKRNLLPAEEADIVMERLTLKEVS